MPESERKFLLKLAAVAPDAPGYADAASRRVSDRRMREGLVDELGRMRDKLADLMRSAEDEGEEDMKDDLDRLDARMERTASALGDGAHEAAAFFQEDGVAAAHRESICAFDLQLLEDMELLRRDVMGMKYETIGNLTLREVEGTLAAIELRIANRKDVLEGGT
jgi:hypothetical protein